VVDGTGVSDLAVCPVCEGSTRVVRDDLYDDRYGYPEVFTLRACPACGHRYVEAAFTEAELNSLYSEQYPRGALSVDDFRPYVEVSGFRAWLDGEYASAFRWVPKGVRVLDIGCGFGESLAYHEARGCEAHGIDADENLLRVAERYGLKARVGLFHPKDYDPESFDYVTLDQVIEHVVSPREFLSGVAAVLRPGGIVIIGTPNAGGFGARAFGRRWINWHVPYHLQQFSRRSLSIAARRSGLSVVTIRTVTNSRWLRFQWIHAFSCPPPGAASPFWDPTRSHRTMPLGVERSAALLERTWVFQLVTRISDGFGSGDNFLCVLRKPE
jgi:2-polyprenyl-3-methyl-5-hydroxy-6-metoxy-1,4-benzoquinol methylase